MEFGGDSATLPVLLAEHSSVPSLPYYQTLVSLRLARWEEPPQGTVSNPNLYMWVHMNVYMCMACVVYYIILYINRLRATVIYM